VTGRTYDATMAQKRQIVIEGATTCSGCGVPLAPGELVQVDVSTNQHNCLSCAVIDEPLDQFEQPFSLGTPGGAAQREYNRRRQNDRDRARRELPVRIALVAFAVIMGAVIGAKVSPGHGALFGVFGGLVAIAYLSQRKQSTEAWAIGAKGERAVAARLAKVASKGVVSLHDRRIPGSRTNIDHIAIGPSGIYVIDTKVVSGSVSVKTTGPIWNRGPVKLFIRGRDKSSFVDGMDKQINAVAGALSGSPFANVDLVQPMVVLVSAEVGFFARPWKIRGVWIGWPKEMARIVSKSGPLSTQQVQQLSHVLASRLPLA
jgi:hypothetical protein